MHCVSRVSRVVALWLRSAVSWSSLHTQPATMYTGKLIDIGVNLTDPMFKGIYNGSQKHVSDLKDVIERAFAVGMDKMIITSGCLQDVKDSLEIARTDERLFTTVGCHPTRCLEFEASGDSDFADNYMESLLQIFAENKDKIVAVGEFGLDFDRCHFCPKEVQLKYFERQLDIAETTRLPLFIHCRNSAKDLLNVLIRNRDKFRTGVVHSFDGTLQEAEDFLKLGLYIGINGCSLKTETNLEVVKQIPKERLLIETDAPWCEVKRNHASFPFVRTIFESKKKEKFVPHFQVKGRNEPSNLIQILEILSSLRSEEIEDFGRCLYDNTVNLFFDQKVTKV